MFLFSVLMLHFSYAVDQFVEKLDWELVKEKCFIKYGHKVEDTLRSDASTGSTKHYYGMQPISTNKLEEQLEDAPTPQAHATAHASIGAPTPQAHSEDGEDESISAPEDTRAKAKRLL